MYDHSSLTEYEEFPTDAHIGVSLWQSRAADRSVLSDQDVWEIVVSRFEIVQIEKLNFQWEN